MGPAVVRYQHVAVVDWSDRTGPNLGKVHATCGFLLVFGCRLGKLASAPF